jgi:POT family proton-dependent oligopeptide transporter
MTMDRTSAATAAAAGPPPAPALPDRSFFGHPRGLSTLFFTELWERFSYYGMRAILILFMTAGVAQGGLGFDTARAGAIYGLYTGFVYLMALPGGWVADRILGARRAVLWGGIIIALGHFSLAVPAMATFYGGLVLIVIGTGLLKPNVSAIVGDLYPEGGARRDAGFSIFYMGINIGAFTAPLVVGFLGERVNWHAGFAAAGVGMVLGIVQYVAGQRHLAGAGEYVAGDAAARARARRGLLAAALVAAALAAAGARLHATGVVNLSAARLAGVAGLLIAALAAVYFAAVATGAGLTSVERRRVGVIFVLFLFSAVFWGGFEQAGSSLTLVAERLTDRGVLGWEVPASWLQSVNPLFIIAFAPVFAWLWVGLARRALEPSSPAKFALGLILLGTGFAVLVAGTTIAATGRQIGPGWLIATYFLHTSGELCLSPVGLSTVTKLAPQRLVGQMMGVWFMAIALGNLAAGQVAGQFERLPLPQLFGAVAVITIGAGLGLALFVRPIRRMMGGVH